MAASPSPLVQIESTEVVVWEDSTLKPSFPVDDLDKFVGAPNPEEDKKKVALSLLGKDIQCMGSWNSVVLRVGNDYFPMEKDGSGGIRVYIESVHMLGRVVYACVDGNLVSALVDGNLVTTTFENTSGQNWNDKKLVNLTLESKTDLYKYVAHPLSPPKNATEARNFRLQPSTKEKGIVVTIGGVSNHFARISSPASPFAENSRPRRD